MVHQSQFIEMFGVAPNHNHRISDYLNLKAGKNISAEEIQSSNNGTLYPCFGGNGLRGYVKDYTHDGNYVLIGRQGALCGNVQRAEGKFFATEHAVVVSPKIDIDLIWLYHALLAMNLNQYARGVAQPGLAVNQLEQISFIVPDINQQKSFSSIANQADKSKFDGLKSQFIEMFGDTFQNERGWTYKKLPEVSTIVLGSTPSSSNAAFWDGDVKWITPAELSDDSFYLYDSERHITEEGVKSTSLKPFPAGTVILSTRAPIGKTAIAGCEMYCNQGFKNFVCDNTINPVYLFYTLRIHNPELQKMGTGSTFLELSKKAIEQISISVPPKELQDEFEQFYKQADKSKYLN